MTWRVSGGVAAIVPRPRRRQAVAKWWFAAATRACAERGRASIQALIFYERGVIADRCLEGIGEPHLVSYVARDIGLYRVEGELERVEVAAPDQLNEPGDVDLVRWVAVCHRRRKPDRLKDRVREADGGGGRPSGRLATDRWREDAGENGDQGGATGGLVHAVQYGAVHWTGMQPVIQTRW